MVNYSLILTLQNGLYLEAVESNTTSGLLNHFVQPIKSCFTFKFTKSWRKRQLMFLRMTAEYEIWLLVSPEKSHSAV